jgi:hypothetical protein
MVNMTHPLLDDLIDDFEPDQFSPKYLDGVPTLKLADQVDLIMLKAHSLTRMLVAQRRHAPDGDVDKVVKMIGELLGEARTLQNEICMRLDG